MIDDRAKVLFHHRVNGLGVGPCLALFKEYGATFDKELGELTELEASKEPKTPASWRQTVARSRRRFAEAKSLLLFSGKAAGWEQERANETLFLAVGHFRDYLKRLYIHRALPEIRPNLSRCRQRFSPTPTDNEGSYLAVMRQFNETLGSAKDKVGVLGYLAERYVELKTPRGEQGRSFGLLAAWGDAEYDKHIGRLLDQKSPDAPIDWKDVERRVFQAWRDLDVPKSWKDVKSVGELLLALFDVALVEPLSKGLIEEFAQTLAQACEALLGGFAIDLKALEQFEKESHRKSDINRLYQFRTYSAPYLRKSTKLKSEDKVDTSLSVRLGMADLKSPQAEEFQRALRESAKDSPLTLSDLNDKTFEMKDDAIVLYQEKTGIPICYDDGLDKLGEYYDASDHVSETHIDYRAMRQKLPEIRLVEDDREKKLAECLTNTIYAYIMGIVRFDDVREEFRFGLGQEGGDSATISVGKRFEEVPHNFAGHTELCDKMRGSLKQQCEVWMDHAEEESPERLVLLWYALQWTHREVGYRVQVLRDASNGELKASVHPLVYILGTRMLPFIRKKVAQIADHGALLETANDMETLLDKNPEFDVADRRRVFLAWEKQIKPYFEWTEDVPIPVIKRDVSLKRYANGQASA